MSVEPVAATIKSAPYSNLAVAIITTANARLHLLNLMEQATASNVLYTDTGLLRSLDLLCSQILYSTSESTMSPVFQSEDSSETSLTNSGDERSPRLLHQEASSTRMQASTKTALPSK